MEKSGIDIVCSSYIDIRDIEEVFFGIEEEGIPYILKFSDEKIIDKESYVNGKFEIGIGINSNGDIFLNQKKYSKEYIIKENINSPKEILRIFGQNSARVLKGLPLR